MEFSLQDIGSGGWGGVSEDTGAGGDSGGSNGIISALENIGVNVASDAAAIGLDRLSSQALTNRGVYTSYNPSLLTARPGTVPPYASYSAVKGSTLAMAGFVILGGILLFAALRRKD